MVDVKMDEEIEEAGIYAEQFGSDHCPVYVKLKKQPDPPPHETPALSSKFMRKVGENSWKSLMCRNKRVLALFLQRK